MNVLFTEATSGPDSILCCLEPCFLEHCVDPNEMLRKRYVHLMLSPRDESCCICSDLIVDVTRCYSRDVLNVICGRLGRYSVSSN